jgi:hypothetical protein
MRVWLSNAALLLLAAAAAVQFCAISRRRLWPTTTALIMVEQATAAFAAAFSRDDTTLMVRPPLLQRGGDSTLLLHLPWRKSMRYSSLWLSLQKTTSSVILITSDNLESTKVPLRDVVGGNYEDDDDDDDDDDASNPVSSFGTREYWDAVYTGHGDFPADEYSWYYGWTELSRWVREYVVTTPQDSRILVPGIGNDPLLVDLIAAGCTHVTAQDYSRHALDRQRDLLQYHFHCQQETEPSDAVADSQARKNNNKQETEPSDAVADSRARKDNNNKQETEPSDAVADSRARKDNNTSSRNNDDEWTVTVSRKGSDTTTATSMARIRLSYSNVKNLPASWKDSFTTILEKGLLDAVYLSSASGSNSGTRTTANMDETSGGGGGGSGDGSYSIRHGPLECAVASLASTLVPGGIFVSVSGVVPDELRRLLFPERNHNNNDDDDDNDTTTTPHSWEWLRDGTNDLQAGCFIFRKL